VTTTPFLRLRAHLLLSNDVETRHIVIAEWFFGERGVVAPTHTVFWGVAMGRAMYRFTA
jgi:hypothetical protein